jgi:hypothetical protein
VDLEGDAGHALLRGTRNHRQSVERGRTGEPEPDQALSTGRDAPYRASSVGETVEIPDGLAVEEFARGRPADLASGPFEKSDTQFFLQLPDRLRHCWLRQSQSCRGTTEVPLLGNRDEVLEVSQFHAAVPPRCSLQYVSVIPFTVFSYWVVDKERKMVD